MKHDSLYIIMPAYNEEKNIGTVIEQWYPVVERIGGESRLVILNDGSRDGTYEMIRKYQKKYERLIGIDKPNEGHGGTILRGYHYAVDAGADYIFQTDSDGQTLPFLPRLLLFLLREEALWRPIPMARHFLMNSGSSGKRVKHAGY